MTWSAKQRRIYGLKIKAEKFCYAVFVETTLFLPYLREVKSGKSRAMEISFYRFLLRAPSGG